MSAKRYWALLIAVLSVTAFLAVAGGDTGRRTTSAVPAKPPDKTAPLGEVAASQLLTNSEALGTLPGTSTFAAIGSKPMAPDEVSPGLSNTDDSISAKAEIEFLIHLIVAAKEAGEVPNPAWYDRLTELSPPTPGGRTLDQGNDACPPTVITACPYTDTGTTVGYVNNYTTCIAANSAPDVIYQYTPTTTGVHVVSLCGSGYDTALEIRTGGTCPGTTQVGCNDDFCGLQSQLSVSLTAGTTYYIIVDGYGSNSGSYVLNLTCPSACTPDATINAPGSYSASTCGAGDDCALRAGADRIVRVNIPVSGQWTFSLCHPTVNWDTYMYLTTACCGGTTLATDDDACPEFGVGLSLINCFQLAAGTYYVDIEPYSSTLCSTFTLTVFQCAPCIVNCVSTECPENPADTTFYRTDCDGGCNSDPDMFASIACGESRCGVGFTYIGPGGGNYRDTDWYLFTITEPETVTVTTVAEFPVITGIVTGVPACTAPSFVVSATALACSTARATAICLAPGTYALFVAPSVFTGYPTPGEYTTHITCGSCAMCVPDFTVNAPGVWTGNTCGAGDDCSFRLGEDHIYRVNIPTTGQWTFKLCEDTYYFDTYLFLSSQCCASIINSNDDGCSPHGLQSIILCQQLTAGTYYVEVEPFSNTGCGNYTLTIQECLPCVITCEPSDVVECFEDPTDTTFYRTDCNGGCNSEPDLFQTLGCGQTVCGDVFTYLGPGGGNYRDTDWYLFTMSNASDVTWTVVAEVAVNLFILDVTDCINPVVLVSGSASEPCTPVSITANALGPGTYAVWVGTQLFSGIPPSDYRGTLTWECPVTAGPFLRIGDWMNPEPWHNWIGGPYDITRVQLHMLDPLNSIQFVEFLFSMDGETWQPFYTDADGYEPTEDTYNPAIISDGDGWSGYFPHEMVPQQNMILHFRAVAYGSMGTVVVENRTNYDPTPPSSVITNVPDWMPTPHDFIVVDIDPEFANIDCVIVWCEEKADTFNKGIPGISQQPHSPTHCAPTAMAACLKYFEAQGDTDVCGGQSDHDLVDSLASRCGTNQGHSGTNPSDLANGTRGWINDHGGGYTVRGPLDFNWQEMRDELERCQDVLSGIRWTGGGSHRMTFNSIVNRPDPNTGRIRVDFMDPWTGQTEWGDMDPATGQVSGFTGAGASGTLGNTIIVCPAESDPGGGGGGGGGGGPGPNPGPIPIPLPHPGLWFLHMIVIDLDAHAHRLIRVVERLLPPILDLVIHPSGNDLILYWSAIPYATSYRVYTAPTPDGPWVYHATTPTNSYTHVNGNVSGKLFYFVTSVRP